MRLKGSRHQGQRWAEQLWRPENANFNLPQAHSFCTGDISDKQVLREDGTEQLAVTVRTLALLPPPGPPTPTENVHFALRRTRLLLGGFQIIGVQPPGHGGGGKEGGRSLRNDHTG